MLLKVGELPEHLAKRQESSLTAQLDLVEVDDQATQLRIKENALSTKTYFLDETANAAVAKFFSIPVKFYEDLTPDFRATLLRYKIDRHKEVHVTFESLNNQIISVHNPSQTMLPLGRVTGVITKVMDDSDTVRRIQINDRRLHVDVTTTSKQVVFPVANEVGDITEGGLRFLSYPFKNRKPSVGAYLERLVCTNGMCTSETVGTIDLKGRTVDEVILAMETAAEEVLGKLDDHLTDYRATRTMEVPGSPSAFVAQLAREANVGRRVLDKVLDIVNQLPEPVTVWDVNQAFTEVANQMESYLGLVRLQTLGGSLAMNAEKMVQRCKTCEQSL